MKPYIRIFNKNTGLMTYPNLPDHLQISYATSFADETNRMIHDGDIVEAGETRYLVELTDHSGMKLRWGPERPEVWILTPDRLDRPVWIIGNRYEDPDLLPWLEDYQKVTRSLQD